jgi:hypothetical protein
LTQRTGPIPAPAADYAATQEKLPFGGSDQLVLSQLLGGGLTETVVPDNLKSAVSRPCRYEPELNPTYHDLALHYGVAVMRARVRKPRDKAKVEVGVQVVERWILARLRHRTLFFVGGAQ